MRVEEESEEEESEEDDSDSDSDSDEERRRRRRRRMRMMTLISRTETVDSHCLRGALGVGPVGLRGQVGVVSERRSFHTPDSYGMESRSVLGARVGVGIEGVGEIGASASVYTSTRVRSEGGRTSVEFHAGGNMGVDVGDLQLGVGADVGLRLGDGGEVDVSAGVNVLGFGVQAGIGTSGPSFGVSAGPVKLNMLGF